MNMSSNNDKALLAAAEAILFACGEPLEGEKIASALNLELEESNELLLKLQKDLDKNNRGICLLILGGKYQLASREEFIEQIRYVLDKKRNTPLTQASLEVLAIIAYNQPVTRAFVEQVRGVDCGGVISTLTEKKLIEEKGRLDLPGRPLVYCTTVNFLRCFSISDLSQLPEIPEESSIKDVENDADLLKFDASQIKFDGFSE